MFKFTIVLAALAFFASSAEARIRPLRGWRGDGDGDGPLGGDNDLPGKGFPGFPGKGELPEDMLEDFFVDINCTDVVVPDQPACAIPRPPFDAGIWVCRTWHHPRTGQNETFSACIDSEHALDTDDCGCCDKECPDPCTCTCDLEADGDGVYVQFTRKNGEVRDKCVKRELAATLTARGARANCTTVCPTTTTDAP